MLPEQKLSLTRRALLKSLGMAPLALRSAPLFGAAWFNAEPGGSGPDAAFPFSDLRLTPHYPAKSPLADVLRLVTPGLDGYLTEQYALEIEGVLRSWGAALRTSVRELELPGQSMDAAVEASRLAGAVETKVRASFGIEVVRRSFAEGLEAGRERLLKEIQGWLGLDARVETAEFEITSIEEIKSTPITVRLYVRYDVVTARAGGRQERVGSWRTEWMHADAGGWRLRRLEALGETLSSTQGPGFVDVTAQAFGKEESYAGQMLLGSDHWRTVLDGACGIDVYGNNGVAVGDFDGDGLDDLYVCQPAGLPNRLYRNRGDGRFEDVTERAGVGVLDNSSCALFADFDNRGHQDLVVVCSSGPLLFLNQGDGRFAHKRDAFQFSKPPEGSFTHAAIADYDGDGRLDIYFCLYSYYLGLDQYHYPVPYFDARNGPPNFLLHNEGGGRFVDRTEAAGLNAENDRYSFACAWGQSGTNGLPDLYVANDFGRANLYRNDGSGRFKAISSEAHVQDAGAGMSACWADFDNDGRQDIYSANMWSAAGQRVAGQAQFHAGAPEEIKALYRRHARGNALYRNSGDGRFTNVSTQAGVEMGRWSWCSDFWDFDQDGRADLYVANGYVTAPDAQEASRNDLGSFFWRQVVAKSPEDATPSLAYEHGWNALNELIRSDSSWSGHERNVLFANNGDGTFAEVSGAVGMDFPEDSRAFALADLDQDGRLEVVLKNRNGPQLRVMRNGMTGTGNAVVLRLRGHVSNRDAIGAAVTVVAGQGEGAGAVKQTRYLQAGSGFLAQHSKEMHFGVGTAEGTVSATVRWPSGLVQEFAALPVNHRIALEEGVATIEAKAFATSGAFATGAAKTLPQAKPAPLPTQVGSWLIEPLRAPEFALPDLAGKTVELRSLRGRLVLLTFWAGKAAASVEMLRELRRQRAGFAAAQMEVLAVSLDEPNEVPGAKAIAAREGFGFPVVFATEDVAGIYNILYRYLFDRRRDLGIPTSLLLDTEGRIVKVYQGAVDPKQVVGDARSVPGTAEERMRRAIPFAGQLYQGAFQRNDFTYGVAMFQHGYLDEAAASFQQVVAAKPDDAEGYYNLGTLNLRKKDYVQARQYLEQTLKLKPNYPEAWNNLGMMAAQQGRADEAVKNFQQSLSQRPDYAIALLNLGNVYRRQGAMAQAQDCLNRALRLQPDDPEVHYSLGMLFAQQEKLKDASAYLQKAIELRPDYPEALNNLGVIFVRQQAYAQAEEQFKAGIRVAPNFDQSYLNLARLYALQNDKQKARDVLQELLRLQPQNASARQTLEMLN